MKNTYKVLIIDDHPAIVDSFKHALQYVTTEDSSQHFQVFSAFDVEAAYGFIKDTSNTNLDLVILDISLPKCKKLKINSGEDLGELIRKHLPKTKILICTFFSDRLRLYEILKRVNPEGFLCKGDMDIVGFSTAIKNVLLDRIYYSRTIVDMIKKKSLTDIELDKLDIQILKELTNGSKMKDLIEIIPLTKSGIDKRKRLLKKKLQIDSNSDRDLVITAKKRGII